MMSCSRGEGGYPMCECVTKVREGVQNVKNFKFAWRHLWMAPVPSSTTSCPKRVDKIFAQLWELPNSYSSAAMTVAISIAWPLWNSDGGRENCITKVERSHISVSILGSICVNRWRWNALNKQNYNFLLPRSGGESEVQLTLLRHDWLAMRGRVKDSVALDKT